MTTKKITNVELLNAIRKDASTEYQENIPLATMNNLQLLASTFENYPTAKNEFINTLTNRIGRQLFYDKVFKNPLKMLHKGMLPYGKSIEQMFTEMAEEKGFNDNFANSTSMEGDLIKPTKPSVKVDYISQNFEYKFKTSISDLQLAGAFTSQFGLMELITRCVNSLASAMQYAEFRDMKKILTNESNDNSNGSNIKKGLVQSIETNNADNSIVLLGSTLDAKKLAKKIRMFATKLTFPSTDYNLAEVRTFSNKEDLVLFTIPEVTSELDVEVLAQAFNVSSAEVNVRTIEVDDLGTTSNNNPVLAILADKDAVQSYDTINTTTTFYNGERMTTNYFGHKHGIMAGCKFANAIVFVQADSLS